MNEVIALSLTSMHQDMTRLERIGMNLANALTPGYKREVVVTQSTAPGTFAGLVDAGAVAGSPSDSLAAGAALAPATRILTDQRAGSLKRTGSDLDLALAGEGYFELATEAGPAYTRQGNFHVDARGRLVSAQGHSVMGEGGEIVLSSGRTTIDARGQVFDSGDVGEPATATPVAQIKVVRFESGVALQRVGNGLLRPAAAAATVATGASSTLVRQGYLEESNVSSMQEMVQLMQTMRHFETMQKIAVGYDDMVGVAIRKLGDMS